MRLIGTNIDFSSNMEEFETVSVIIQNTFYAK